MAADLMGSDHRAPCPQEGVAGRAARLVEEFASVGDWLDRYRYLVELGERMPRLDPSHHTEANRLPGCQYALWVTSEYHADTGTLHFRADSDARIARGLAALALRVLDGLPPSEIADADLGFLQAMGLDSHLSLQRGAGLNALIEELRRRARACSDSAPERP